MRLLISLSFLTCIASVNADDISRVPLQATCILKGMSLEFEGASKATERELGLEYLSMPPLRDDMQSLSDSDLGCLYVAGWRERAIYGDNLASEKLCYTRNQGEERSIFACQVVGHKNAKGEYIFDNMDCENGELDRISLNAEGFVVSSDFASARNFAEHKSDFFLGSGQCDID